MSNPGNVTTRELHHFADASNIGYGTASYLREIFDDGSINVSLLYGKGRVAPLKKITIPRLELSAAKDAVKANATITQALNEQIDATHYWTDSTAVLKYIYNRNARFQTFVANRLEYIHSGSEPAQWHHVQGKNNPADYASRGLHVHEEEKAEMWFNGPAFLQTDTEFSQFSDVRLEDDDAELKKTQICIPAVHIDESFLLNRFSTLSKLQRVAAWIFRFIGNVRILVRRRKEEEHTAGAFLQSYLTRTEIQNAQVSLIKLEQARAFNDDMERLQQGKTVAAMSCLKKLDPFVDENGLIRVGGRLSRSNTLDYEGKHPIILPKTSKFTELLVQHIHRIGHVGKNHTVSKLRERFWIFGIKQVVKRCIAKCVFCRKYSARLGQQKMSDLPLRRVNTPEHVFKDVGVDFLVLSR